MVLRIISIENVLFNGVVDMVTLPGISGSFTVLNNHAPLITLLANGAIVYVSGGQRKSLDVAGGVVEVRNNKVAVLLE